MHQEIIPWTLADNPEVVYEREVRLAILQGGLKTLLRNASRLVLDTSRLTGTADALWLEMEFASNVATINGKRDQSVQGTA